MSHTTRHGLIVCLIALGAGFAWFVLTIGGFRREYLIVSNLILGWIPFLKRTLPEVRVNAAGIGMVALCSAIGLFGVNTFLRRLLRSASSDGTANNPIWRWRWSVATLCAFWLLFVLVMASSGLFRQIAWLEAFEENWMSKRRYGYSELYAAGTEVLSKFLDNPNATEADLTIFADSNTTVGEQFHFMMFPSGSSGPAQVLLFHRDPVLQRTTGFMVIANDKDGASMDHLPIEELPEMIAKLGKRSGGRSAPSNQKSQTP